MCYSLSLYTDLKDALRLPPLMWGCIADSSEAIRHPSFYRGTISYFQHCVLSQLLAPPFFPPCSAKFSVCVRLMCTPAPIRARLAHRGMGPLRSARGTLDAASGTPQN